MGVHLLENPIVIKKVEDDETIAQGTVGTTETAHNELTFTIKANEVVRGTQIRLRCSGYMSNSIGTPPTHTWKWKIGSTVVVQTGAQTVASGAGTGKWEFDLVLTFDAVGAGGQVWAQGLCHGVMQGVAQGYKHVPMASSGAGANTAVVAIDTTADMTFTFTLTYGGTGSVSTNVLTNGEVTRVR